jgi:hypothetical protein
MSRPTLQVTGVKVETESGPDPRMDDVVVTMWLSRQQATRRIPHHLIELEVFNAVGEWWDEQVAYEDEP